MKNLLCFFLLFCVATITQAQKVEYTYTVVPPVDMRMPPSEFKGIGFAERITTLPNGQQLSWRITYSTNSHTFYVWFFAKPEGMSQTVFENSVNAMANSVFWKAANACTYQTPESIADCINSTVDKATAECKLPNGLPCWADKK